MAEEKLNERISEDVKRYVRLRMDDTKLAVMEGLSAVAGSAIAFFISLLLLNLALFLFTGVFVYLIHLLVESWVWSAVIMGAIYLIVGIWVFMRPGFFRNRMVRLFAPMFFCHKKVDDDE